MKAQIIKIFCLFLTIVALFGATIALINQYLRLHNMTSPLSLGILGGVLFVVYYNVWRWLCRKLDKLNNE